MNSLGWSRREEPVNTSKPSGFYGTLQNLNPFNSGNVRLPTHEDEGPGAPLPARSRREEEEGWFARKSTHTFYITRALCLGVNEQKDRRIIHSPKRGVHVTSKPFPRQASQPA